MVLAGNKAKCLSLVNHTTKTFHHHLLLFKIKGNVNNKVSEVKATITTLKSKTGDFYDGLKLFYEGL